MRRAQARLPLAGATHWPARPGTVGKAAPVVGRGPPEVGFGPPPALALGTEGCARRTPCPGTAPGLSRYLPFCPSQENPAPSRPFEKWILLTYLAALASRVESWVLPDRVGILFVPLSESRIPLEQGECASAPRCPPMPRPGVAALAPLPC